MQQGTRLALRSRLPKPKLGWREWVRFPDFDDVLVKAKIDTGARTSAIHAFDIRKIEREGEDWLAFNLHPVQRHKVPEIACVARLLEERYITSSNGQRQLRPVVRVPVIVASRTFDIDLTLTNRDEMGFRMLLGREALKKRFLIDPGRSYLGGKKPKEGDQ
ncbi:ATP-dependent zinc protease family protein [Sphingomicrobium clamense]|nr:RimK/LysX family protein [Sphingomicrobium sp. B8]